MNAFSYLRIVQSVEKWQLEGVQTRLKHAKFSTDSYAQYWTGCKKASTPLDLTFPWPPSLQFAQGPSLTRLCRCARCLIFPAARIDAHSSVAFQSIPTRRPNQWVLFQAL